MHERAFVSLVIGYTVVLVAGALGLAWLAVELVRAGHEWLAFFASPGLVVIACFGWRLELSQQPQTKRKL